MPMINLFFVPIINLFMLSFEAIMPMINLLIHDPSMFFFSSHLRIWKQNVRTGSWQKDYTYLGN